jgi:hypothetical protein
LSDITSLMMFDHQSHAMNLLTRLNWEARILAAAGPLETRSDAIRSRVDELADYLLFVGEAPLALTVTPRPGLAEYLAARTPHDRKGRSLGQFDLEQRLMRYPCSYMIYSPAFDGLPPDLKRAVYRRMHTILTGSVRDSKYAHLTPVSREAILDILLDTKPDFALSVSE